MLEQGRKRGRERTYDSQKTREAILNAAESVFAEHGYEGASMDTIARVSGYNKSLLFQYFDNKLGLYSQVLKRADTEMSQLVAQVFSPLLADETITTDAGPFRDFLKNMCGAFFDYMVAHPQMMRLFNWEQAEGWRTFTELAAQFEPKDLAKFEALFSKARGAGLLRPGLDSVVALGLIQQVCWSTPAALPLYQSLFAGRNLLPADALALLRQQTVDFLVSGMLGVSSE